MRIFIFLFFLVWSSSIFALDTTPFCRISHPDGIYSGIIVGDSDDYIYVLTCAHGPDSDPQVQILVSEEVGLLGFPAKFVVKDHDRDLALLSIYKLVDIHPKLMSIGKTVPKSGDKITLKGFPKGSMQLSTQTLTFDSDKSVMSMNQEFLFQGNGPIESGMSGSAWILNNEIVSIQSTSNQITSLGASQDQIRIFLNTKNVSHLKLLER